MIKYTKYFKETLIKKMLYKENKEYYFDKWWYVFEGEVTHER